MELAGIVSKKANDTEVTKETLEEEVPGFEGYFGMQDEVQWYDTIEGFNSLIKSADDSDSDKEVETLDSINKRSEDLYPGKKYHGMYAGENMMESVNYIDKLDDKDSINLPNLL